MTKDMVLVSFWLTFVLNIQSSNAAIQSINRIRTPFLTINIAAKTNIKLCVVNIIVIGDIETIENTGHWPQVSSEDWWTCNSVKVRMNTYLENTLCFYDFTQIRAEPI